MSKTTAPLLSFDAAGQVGKSLVFAKWRGIGYARRYVIPANPKTTSQTFQRGAFATLREAWKRMDADARAPWDAYASGRPFLGVNAWIKENRLSMTTDSDISGLIGSPGARGGIPLTDFTAAAGSGSGEIDLDWSLPSLPTDWTGADCWALIMRQQAPDAILVAPPQTAEVAYGTHSLTVTGLTADADYVVAGWIEMTKPDGSTAYSPSIEADVTATA